MKKKKVQDVVINMYLMEWNEKEQELKAKWGSSYLENLANCELQYTTQCSRREEEEFP